MINGIKKFKRFFGDDEYKKLKIKDLYALELLLGKKNI